MKDSILDGEDEKKQVYTQTILFIFKICIDMGQENYFSNFVSRLYEVISLDPNNNYLGQIFYTITAYLYYLSFKEPLVSESARARYSSFLTHYNENNENLLKHVKLFAEDSWKYYKSVKAVLRGWELHPEGRYRVKTVLMGTTIDQFFLFNTAFTNHFDLLVKRDPHGIFDETQVYTLLSYFDKTILSNNYLDEFQKFMVWMEGSPEDGERKMSLFCRTLMEVFKQSRLKKSEITPQQQQNIQKYRLLLTSTLNNHPFFQLKPPLLSEKNITATLLTTAIPPSYFDNDKDYSVDNYRGTMAHNLEIYLYKALMECGVPVLNLHASKSKHNLFQLVETLSSQPAEIQFDTLVPYELHTLENSIFFDDKDTQLKKRLYEIERTMRQTPSIWGYSLYYYSQQVHFTIDNCTTTITGHDEKEIAREMDDCKDNETYWIPITNDIRLEMSKEEAYEYLKGRFIRLRVQADIRLEIGDSCAALIVNYKTD